MDVLRELNPLLLDAFLRFRARNPLRRRKMERIRLSLTLLQTTLAIGECVFDISSYISGKDVFFSMVLAGVSTRFTLAPGSLVVTEYLEKSGLLPYLEKLGYNVVGYGCISYPVSHIFTGKTQAYPL
jgi:hypothetical protein